MADTTAKRWEYETVRPPRNPTMQEASDPEEVLNEFGSDGWELIGTIDYSGGGTKFLVFKRPVDEERDE
ncbi:DUF4177 domain-containing protein [Natronolimnohabitans sp. A-GB9]|uniref:DUF4177 domain-containing protein n=1 Tax=Natronolimnohabitans sp. A-GB9 TaxID=3069757 RepID=UPI0027B2BF4D|nr:DUF4177 domain-containing protein [Natronolimnohabitans sp. A-GB9]MDQ2050408.1 DUF4177 domain-containing protein [Natronolimnohabitans sp. A-GB9]